MAALSLFYVLLYVFGLHKDMSGDRHDLWKPTARDPTKMTYGGRTEDVAGTWAVCYAGWRNTEKRYIT